MTDDSWDVPDMERVAGGERDNNGSTTDRDGEAQPEKGVLQHV